MMSVATVDRIAAGLIKAGMAEDMPCAVIENGTYPKQRKFVSDLENICRVVRENKVKSPAVIMFLSNAFTMEDIERTISCYREIFAEGK